MTDEEIESVEEEAVAQPAESDQEDNERQEDAQEEQQPRRRDVDYNWAEARRRMQDLERRTQEQAEELSRLRMQPKQVEEDDLSTLADDDIVTAAQARKLAQKMARQVAEDVVRQREHAGLDDRIKAKFPDYDQVVSMENIETLKQTEPELAMSLQAMSSDPYAQAVAAYKLLKKVGLGQGVVREMSNDKKKALQNIKKPIPAQTVAKQSAIGSAHMFENGLSQAVKDQLWKEMQEASKG